MTFSALMLTAVLSQTTADVQAGQQKQQVDAVLAAAFGTQAPAAGAADGAQVTAPPESSGGRLWLGAAALGVLALGTAIFTKKKRAQSSLVHVLETVAIGPRRSLSVVRMGDETLLLGSSEAGITLLTTRLVSPEVLRAADAQAAQLSPPSLARKGEAESFEALLDASSEDQALRIKLLQGLKGEVAQ